MFTNFAPLQNNGKIIIKSIIQPTQPTRVVDRRVQSRRLNDAV